MLGYLNGISFLGYDFQSYPNSQKISLHILRYPFISYHIPTYPKISSGANSQMYGSFGRAMASTLPGRSAQLQDAVDHTGSSNSDRRPAAALRGGGLSEWPVHRELSGATRHHRVAGAAAGLSAPPGASGRQSSRGPRRWRPVIGRWRN